MKGRWANEWEQVPKGVAVRIEDYQAEVDVFGPLARRTTQGTDVVREVLDGASAGIGDDKGSQRFEYGRIGERTPSHVIGVRSGVSRIEIAMSGDIRVE